MEISAAHTNNSLSSTRQGHVYKVKAIKGWYFYHHIPGMTTNIFVMEQKKGRFPGRVIIQRPV